MRRMRRALLTIGAALALGATASAATLVPSASGSIRMMPGFGIFDVAPVGEQVQSTYFRTTQQNTEFRRGIAEFTVPSAPSRATLVLRENRGTTTFPLPPDTHLVYAYTPADLAVTTADYDRAGVLVGTFDTDSNLEVQTFTFDVTALAVAAAGGTLGFRVQLAVDPVYTGFGFLGSQFVVSLEVTSLAGAIADLTAGVGDLGSSGAINGGNANALQAKLSAVQSSITSGDFNAARGQLEAFVHQLEALVRSGRLTAAQAQPLIDTANALIAALP